MTPPEFYLSQNYPNPFSRRTTIKFCVACRSRVKLDVCNSESKMITRLLDEEKEAGTYEIEFNACGLCAGSYIYILQAGDYVSTRRMVLEK